MRRLMICLILICFAFVLQVHAQDDDYKNLAVEFVKAYSESQDPATWPVAPGPNFWQETRFCTDTPPKTFEALVLSEDALYPTAYPMIVRLGTDQGVLYVAFQEILGADRDIRVQQVICEDSPAGQALKAVAANKVFCWQEDPVSAWVEGQWTNRAEDHALIRFRALYLKTPFFVYVKKEGETWIYEKGLCDNIPEGIALSFITQYMYNYPQAMYYMGSSDAPVFADVTSVRGGYETGQATVLVQLETFDEYQEEEGVEQDDPVCMVNLRTDPWWIVYEMRCNPS